jgi:hypothetical protein
MTAAVVDRPRMIVGIRVVAHRLAGIAGGRRDEALLLLCSIGGRQQCHASS